MGDEVMNIKEMKSGKELDVLVGTRVMGWNVDEDSVPDFSSRIEHAWAVAEKARLLSRGCLYKADGHWCLAIHNTVYTAETAPRVICKAALAECK
jgi:hypothetical protein